MSAAAAPTTAKGVATRARLIETARAEAIRTGGHVELARVAEAASVVPSLVNRYFGSKSGLVSAVVDDFFDRLHTEVLDLDLEEQGPWVQHERLRVELGVRFHYADPFAVVLFGQLSRDPEVAQTEMRRIDAVVGQAAQNIRRAQRRGELPRRVDPEMAGAAMFGAMTQVLVVALRRSPPPPPRRVVDVLWRQVAAAVQLDPSTTGPPRSRST